MHLVWTQLWRVLAPYHKRVAVECDTTNRRQRRCRLGLRRFWTGAVWPRRMGLHTKGTRCAREAAVQPKLSACPASAVTGGAGGRSRVRRASCTTWTRLWVPRAALGRCLGGSSMDYTPRAKCLLSVAAVRTTATSRVSPAALRAVSERLRMCEDGIRVSPERERPPVV